MKTQDILVFCFVLTSSLLSCALSDSTKEDKRAHDFLGKRDTSEVIKDAENKALSDDDFVKRVQEFINRNDFDSELDDDKRSVRGFLGKRDEDDIEEEKRRNFLGKRKPGFLGKRGPHFLGKRGPHFLGKRGPRFLGKRGPRFLGKRGPSFLGKRGGRFFLGKREDSDDSIDSIEEEKRRHFIGKREDLDDAEFGDFDVDDVEKRRHFLGKRAQRNFLGK